MLASECLDFGVLLQILRRNVLNVVIDRENRLRRIGNRSRADLFELGNYRAGVVVRHDMTRTNRNEIAGMNCRAGRKSIRVTRGNLFDESQTHIRQSTINPQLSTVRASLLRGALA